jgi:peptide/nickel transport system permease protein
MLRFTIRRLLGAIPLLLAVAVLSFVFMELAPGGPDTLFGRRGRMSEEQLAAIRHNLGLDEPMVVRLGYWLRNLLEGDLGTSYSQHRPVQEVIWDVLPNTFLLMGTGMLISLAFALTFGVLAARRPHGLFDNVTGFVSYFGLAMPVFWFGLMLQILFAVKLGWLPSAGKSDPIDGGGVLDTLQHLILPSITIAIGSIAGWSRYVRASVIDALGQDHVRTARAKGLSERKVTTGHVLRNALIPFVTIAGIDVPLYLTGAVLVETVFAWPGMGRLFFDSLDKRDYPVLMGVLMLGAVLIVLGNLIADLIYGLLDPRIKYS